ncbi:MAG: four helix bundle protein [Candidatus Riflebacteria bacterium HGW-Riflebacteria-2]|jgi:four helix bundle protein|nr:MAG: four helix bundle protein [Candidatus Riflebacteria bacterium HGW-Riflebacteria-2]
MKFDHEKLDVYRIAIEMTAWMFDMSRTVKEMSRHTKDQMIRAAQSVPLNIAEGNGKRSVADRCRFFEIARGSALECAAVLDILFACKAIAADQVNHGKTLLFRIVSMLTRMIDGGSVREEPVDYDYAHEHDC